VAARTTLAVRLADQRLDHTAGRLRREVAAGLDAGERRLVAAGERLGGRSEAAVRQSEHGLDVAAARLRVLDPAAALARGWSITRRADGTLVRSTAGLAAGEALVTTVADGTVTSVVSEAAS
jgi:exodeoxyribonuclease VII large subunit